MPIKKAIIIIKNALIAVLLSSTLVACTTTGEQTATPTTKSSAKRVGPNFKDASQLNTKLAVGYIQRKQYAAAKEKLEKALEQNDENLGAYKTFAYLYALLGLPEEAQTKYEEALELSPDDSDLSNSYGAFLCSLGKYDEAQKKLKVAYSDPFYEGVYLAQSNAGSCYIKQGEYKQAEPLLRRSLRVQSKLPGSLISMAELGVKTERYLMARAYIQRYHAIKATSAESLWIQIQAEKALGAEKHYMKNAKQLINDFPDSDEAGWGEAQARDEQFR
ncbi:MAG: type IV pilus biogenesis/stability protein PilW [Gammaproteobacteria bacterium]|nr:type IV pilus biogenesis/stability protein PilW [Gammaproteobacteria bacterium]